MSIEFLRENFQRINDALIGQLITTKEAATICGYSTAKSFLRGYKSIAGTTLTKAHVKNYTDGLDKRLEEVSQEAKALRNNAIIIGYFELTGKAWELLANSIHNQNPRIDLKDLRFRGIQFENGWCRVVVTGPAITISGVTPVLGFDPGCDMRTYEGYIALPGPGQFTGQELSALMRGDK